MSRLPSKKFNANRWMGLFIPVVLALLVISLVASIIIVLFY